MNRRRILILAFVVAASLAALGYFGLRARRHPTGLAASGTVEATQAELGFPAGGRITEVLVREGDAIKAGQPLAQLDTLETAARLAQARAQAAVARAQLRELLRGSRPEEIDQAKAALEAAEHSLADAETELARTKRLAANNVVSRQALDRAQVAYDLAVATRTQAKAQLELAQQGPRQERIEAQRAQVATAEAQVRSLDVTFANLTLRSAFDGIVTVRHHEPGETVAAGAPVLTVTNPDDRWVRIYLPENRLGAIRLGMPATIRADTYPGKSYGGRVMFIATEAEFTPRNVQTTEERVKLVYAVKVRISGDPGYELKPGTPADVELEEGAAGGGQPGTDSPSP
jgi:HlyD family secretion protein